MGSHAAVLELMGVDNLDSLVSDAFLKSFAINPPSQYGMVCEDVKAKAAELEALGAGPFLCTNTPLPNWTERGVARECRNDMALGYSNGQQIELLGPATGTSFYKEKIPADGSLALHHVCILQQGIGDIEKRFNDAGFVTLVQGRVGINNIYTTCFKYFDTREALGFYIEITEYEIFGWHCPPGEKLISGLAKLKNRFSA